MKENIEIGAYFIILLGVLVGIVVSCGSIIYHIYELKAKSNLNIIFLPDEEVEKVNPNLLSQSSFGVEVGKLIFLFGLGSIMVILLGVHYSSVGAISSWYK